MCVCWVGGGGGSNHDYLIIRFASDTWKKTIMCVLSLLKFACAFVQADQSFLF